MTAVTSILTLNQIVSKIENIANCHAQLRDFKFLDGTWDAYSSGVANAPELWLTVADVQRTRNTSIFKFTFSILDDVERSTWNQTDVWNDCWLIAEDIIAQLRHPDYGWLVSKSDTIDIRFVSEKHPRQYSGVQFDVTIELQRPDDICQIPFSSNPDTASPFSLVNNSGTFTITTIWGNITGDITNQTDLINYIAAHSASPVWGGITGTVTDQTDLVSYIASQVHDNQSWASALSNGNTTGGHDTIWTVGDKIKTSAAGKTEVDFGAGGDEFNVDIDGGSGLVSFLNINNSSYALQCPTGYLRNGGSNTILNDDAEIKLDAPSIIVPTTSAIYSSVPGATKITFGTGGDELNWSDDNGVYGDAYAYFRPLISKIANRYGSMTLENVDMNIVHTAEISLDAPIYHFPQATASKVATFDSSKHLVGSYDFSTDGTLASNSDTIIPSQKALKTYIDNAVTGLLDFKGDQDCSANPNYPAASKGDAYYVTNAGKIGGASGKSVDVGDLVIAKADNAGGTEASVGTSWFVIEHNLVGALIASNNLNDVSNTTTARANLGLAIGTNVQAWNADLDSWAGVTRSIGFDTFVATPSSANLYSLLTTKTGNSSSAVFADSPALTGNPTTPNQSADDNSTKIANTAYVDAIISYGRYIILNQTGGSLTAGAVAQTYLGLGNLNAQIASNATNMNGASLIYLRAADYPTINGKTTKLRISGWVSPNHTAPTGNFTLGLYPVTQPASSGGAGNKTYTIGTVVSGSDGGTVSTPSADTNNILLGSDFSFPSDGWYLICMLTTATIATNSFVTWGAQLQLHNT